MRDQPVRLLLAVGLLGLSLIMPAPTFSAPPPKSPEVRLDASHAAPRDVEDQTQQAVIRDYGVAWQSLERALEENRADLLAANFVGYAQERWSATVNAQRLGGLSRRVKDHGHNLEVLFYSVDGSAIQMRDTAQLEVQYLDSGKVIRSEKFTAHYITLLTPAENSWKVRILQEIAPGSAQQAALNRVSGMESGSK